MASMNHQFIEYSDQTVKRYIKTVPNIVAGVRLNPHNPQEQISFLLQTSPHDFDFTQHRVVGHTYENDVLELYSDKELKLFLKMNRNLIEQGLIKEYDGNHAETNLSNLLNDEEVKEVAALKPISALTERLSAITSEITLKRILEAAEELNRPHNSIRAIQNRINELEQANDNIE